MESCRCDLRARLLRSECRLHHVSVLRFGCDLDRRHWLGAPTWRLRFHETNAKAFLAKLALFKDELILCRRCLVSTLI